MTKITRHLTIIVFLLLLTLAIGCTEEMDSPSSTASTPPPDKPPLSQTIAPSQSALGGAKRAAINTRDKVADYQKKLEKEMEDN